MAMPLIEKTFFSTRRPALETGGQRPTALCALGRKRVLGLRLTNPLSSCPDLFRVSTSRLVENEDVDGRDKPGHDEGSKTCSTICRNGLVEFSIG